MEKERACVAVLSVLCATVLSIYLSGYLSILSRTHPRNDLSTPQLGNGGCGHGYIMVLRYSGQQGAGVRALVSLQRWVRDMHLPMMIVEPFLQKSVMGIHRPRSAANARGVRFSDMFDLDHFNRVSRSEGGPEIIDWPSYLDKMPRKAVLVRMTVAPEVKIPKPRVTWVAAPDGSECWQKNIPNLMDNTNLSLCFVRVVTGYWKFASRHSFSAEDVYGTILAGLDPSTVTVVLSIWRGPWHTRPHRPQNQQPITNSSSSLEDIFRDSPKLHLSTENYQKKFLTGPAITDTAYVAVMLRAEHSVLQFQHRQRDANASAEMERCLNEVLRETNAALKTVGTSNLLVTADVGYYGSGSWNKTMSAVTWGDVADMQKRIKKSVERLYNGRWSFQDWEDSFSEATGGVEDRGYVAALQRGLASQAACLVLLGGGSFQKLALINYLHHTKNQTHARCVHLVCLERKYSVSFQSMLKSQGMLFS